MRLTPKHNKPDQTTTKTTEKTTRHHKEHNMYEINIALNGTHYFATAERSGNWSREMAIEILTDIRKRFPKEEGYECTLRYNEQIGHQINI